MSIPLRALFVEDSETDALLLLRELRRGGFDVVSRRVETAAQMSEALLEPWDVIIADYRMPNFRGIDALILFKERGADIPFIVVSGAIGEDFAVGMMKAGAHDYLLKSNLMRLAPAIERELRE